jgi:hypothetical protein
MRAMASVPPAPSTAALLYLFADRVIEPDTAMSKAFEVPCTQARVKQVWLAADLFAITFWHLAEEGKLDLAMGKRTLLGAGRPQVTATLRPGVPIPTPQTTQIDPAQLASMGGLPAGVEKLLENLAPQIASAQIARALSFPELVISRLASQQPTPVRDVIRDWFGSDVSDPHRYVVDHMAHELGELGLVTGTTGGGMFSTARPVVDCAKRTTYEAAAVDLLERWRAFRDGEQGLGPTLRDRCKAAIGSRTESSDN